MADPFDNAWEIAQKIKSGVVSSEEIVEMSINRINQFDSQINAVVVRDFEKAIKAARNADIAQAQEKNLGPLHGVPMTIKEAFDIEGHLTTWGMDNFQKNIAKNDALVVEKLKKAGAIIIGKTNVPAMLSDWQSFNQIYGTTNNPWDLTRSPGGSSGGSAAAVAAGFVPIEVGSDIGGSIRGPCHYCGIYGHKPSYGIVPMDGHAVPGIDIELDLIVAGPLARTSRDLRLVLDIIKGPSRQNTPAWSLQLPERKRNNLKEYRVAIFADQKVSKVDNQIIEKLDEVSKFLERNGVSISYDAKPNIDFARTHDLYLTNLRGATGALMNDEEYAAAKQEVTQLDEKDKSYWAYVNRGATQTHRNFFSIEQKRQHVRYAWANFFKEWDIFLCPTAASTAIEHDQKRPRQERTILVNNNQEDYNDQLFWAGLAIFPYLPATVFPVGCAKNNLPVGLQAIGPYLHDRETIRFAELMENAFAGFSKPREYA